MSQRPEDKIVPTASEADALLDEHLPNREAFQGIEARSDNPWPQGQGQHEFGSAGEGQPELESLDLGQQSGSGDAGKSQTAASVGNAAQEKVDQGMDKAAEALNRTAETLRTQGEQRDGAMATVATKAADTLESTGAYLREKDTDQLVSDLEALVRRKPVESLLVAAGIGLVLSKLLR